MLPQRVALSKLMFTEASSLAHSPSPSAPSPPPPPHLPPPLRRFCMADQRRLIRLLTLKVH